MLYLYFHKIVHPFIRTTGPNGAYLAPETLKDGGIGRAPSFWLHPADPTFLLHHNSFFPETTFCPPVLLWHSHVLVQKLVCPHPECKGLALAKNGLLPPRAITDSDQTFYIVSWAYRCRQKVGSKKAGRKRVYRG